jgi:hypothetical protein
MDYEGILFTKQEMTLIVIDAGNSRRSRKLIMDKNSLVFERTVGLFRECPKDLS